jgi:hypothetical protein
MNMHPLNNDQQNIRTKINSISFKHDDESLFICCAEALYEWKLGDTPYRPSNAKTTNFLSAWCIPSSKNEIIASADDCSIKRFTDLSNNQYFENKFDYLFNHLFVFKFSKYLLGSVSNPDIITNKDNNALLMTKLVVKEFNPLLISVNKSSNQNSNVPSNQIYSTCLKLFQDINYLNNVNSNEPLIPAHLGETTRIRVNYDENLIFTSGKDGCINIYSIVENISESPEEAKSLIFTKGLDRYTDIVLLKKSKLKELEIERTNLPEKKNEIKNSKKSAINEEINDLLKKRDDISTRIAGNKKVAQDEIQRKRDELEDITEKAGKELDDLTNYLQNEYERTKNEYQIELTDMQRKVELRREQLRKDKENFKKRMADYKKKQNDEIDSITTEKSKKLENLQNHEKELDEEINNLRINQVSEIETIEWLNKKIIDTIEDNIKQLKLGIENLKNHHKQQENKLKEKKEQQKNDLEVLQKELTQIKEQKQFQSKRLDTLLNQKKAKEVVVDNIKKEIKALEKNIKEKKVWNSNLEKCKYVLDYQIKELKKETGPLDKTIDELKKHTKGLERVSYLILLL